MQHFGRQTFDLAHRLADHPIAFACLLIGSHSGLGRLFGIARDFLHGSGHLIHGGGDLIGFDLLRIDPGTGLLGDRRQLLGRAGQLRHAFADAAHQFTQVQGHALQGQLHLAQFVTPGNGGRLPQITGRNPFDAGQGLAQGADDLRGNGPCRGNAEQGRQRCRNGQPGLRLGGVSVALGGLRVAESVAHIEQRGPQRRHLVDALKSGLLILAELRHRGAVGAQGFPGLLQATGELTGYAGLCSGDRGDRLVDGRQGRLARFVLGAVGVATDLEASLLNQPTGFHQRAESRQVALAEQGCLHLIDFGDGAVGGAAQLAARGLATLDRQQRRGERLAIGLRGRYFLFDQRNVFGHHEGVLCDHQVGIELIEQAIDGVGTGTAFLQFERLSCDAQVAHAVIEYGNAGDLVGPLDQAGQAEPAGGGDQQRKQ